MGLQYGSDQGPTEKQIQGKCLRINTGKLTDCILGIEEKYEFILTPLFQAWITRRTEVFT